MADVHREAYSKIKDPLLELIIQKYTQAARDSIRGPIALKADLQLFKNSQESKNGFVQLPTDEFKIRPTNLDGHTVSSFNVGGEKWLCFTELVQTVLKDINVHHIFKKRDQLLIFTSKCTQKQMEELKYHGVLPWTSTSSNLITKSDAYRLCGTLQNHLAVKTELGKRNPVSFEVYHECFGGCIGVLDPELYTEANSPCVKCTECNCLFTTRKFVSHNHTSYDEVHTCHWGFDSSRWRSYLMLVEQKASRELLTLWNSIKCKFDTSRSMKGKFNSLDQNQDADFVAYIQSPDHKKALVSPIENLRNQESKYDPEGSSAFHPWSPKPTRLSGSRRNDNSHSQQSGRFLFPNAAECSKIHPFSNGSRLYTSGCGCGPTPPYMNCQQCKSAAQAGCTTGLHMLAQKAAERPTDEDIKPKLEIMAPNMCACEQCKHSCKYHHETDLERSFDDIIGNFTSKDRHLTTSTRELARLLTTEIKRLNISQEDKIREYSVSNQRLQTELHLVKMESQKKLNDARDTKVHVEQELETLHRERQKVGENQFNIIYIFAL